MGRMDRSRVGTACLIGAAAGLIGLGIMAYVWGYRNGLAVPKIDGLLQEMKTEAKRSWSTLIPTKEEMIWFAHEDAYMILGVLSLLPLALLVVGIRLVRPRSGVLHRTDEDRVD